MSQYIDENGTWEVTEGNGCINKCLIIPSEKYLAENPAIVDVKAQAIDEIESATTIAGLRTAMLKYVNAE